MTTIVDPGYAEKLLLYRRGAELSWLRMHDKEGAIVASSCCMTTTAGSDCAALPWHCRTLVHTGGSAPLPVKTQMYYRTVLPRNMRALVLSQENTEVCCACSVVEQSVHWETGGSARRLFTIQGHPQPSRPGILWGGRE